MPSMPTGGISVNDGASAPVSVTYTPEVVGDELTILVDRRLASRDLQPSIQRSFLRPTDGRKTYKVTDKIAYPVVRSVSGVDTVVAVGRVDITYALSPAMTEQERKHLLALAVNMQLQVDMRKAPEKLEPFWG